MKFALFDWDLVGLAALAAVALFAIGAVVPAVVTLALMAGAVVIDRLRPRAGHVF